MVAPVQPLRARKQPPQVPIVDWSNPITQGLAFVQVLGTVGGGVGLMRNGKPLTAYNSATEISTGLGRAAQTSSYLFEVGATALNGANYSLLAVGNCISNIAIQSALDDDDGSTRCYQFRLNAGKVELITFDTSNGPYFATAAAAMSNDVLARGFVMGASVAGNSIASYQNGVAVTATASGTQRQPSTTHRVGGRKTGAQPWSSGGLSLVAGWSRTLSAAEQRALSANPWQLFRAPGSRLAAAAVASGVTGTATITEAGDTVSGAGEVLVDAAGNITEAGDTATGAADIQVSGNATVSEVGDTVSAEAAVDSEDVLAAATITEAGDSAAGAASVPVTADATIAEGGDTVAAAATSESAPRYARPLVDLAAGVWVPSSGSSLAAMLDEPSADSSDYISTSAPSTCEVKLNPVVDPGTSSGQVVRYQAWSEEGNGLTVRLKQGATIIASWNHPALPNSPTIFAQTLTVAECDSITNYADLRFVFEAL